MLYQLLCDLLHHMWSVNPVTLDFLNKDDPRFSSLYHVIDNTLKELQKEGVGSDSKHAECLTKEEEEVRWESGMLGTTSSKALLRAVFFLNGKNFCLRGKQEYKDLGLSNLKRFPNPDHYIYVENYFKNRQGGFRQFKMENKSVPIYSNLSAPGRCHVQPLDLYINKLPPVAKDKDIFYWRPLDDIPKDSAAPWFAT